MKKRNLFLSIPIITGIIVFTFFGCKKDSSDPQQSATNSAVGTGSGGTSGIQNAIPAYYDSVLHTIMFSPFSATAAATLIAHNKSINLIYQSDPGLPNNQPFISVINALPGGGPGFNPVWREVQIAFNNGFTPRQLYSDNEVIAAASGNNPEITLDTTNEVYWCPVIGRK